jgi:A/G-specific adenine glycosylase
MELPGIGPYTARAVAVFAYGRAEAVVDTNVQRILQRLHPRSSGRIDFQKLADRLLARRSPYDWNQAVMELGATICTPSSPRCHACPIAPYCPSAGKAARVASKAKSHERLHRGQPRRIYRGRVLALLLASDRPTTRTDRAIARVLFPNRSASDSRFIREVLVSLKKDGLVSLDTRRSVWKVRPLR